MTMIGLAMSPCNPMLSATRATFSPADLFGPSDAGDWGDAADLANGAPVAQWDGRRGVVSFRQATPASQPAATTSGGLSSAAFNGTSQSLASAAALDLSATDKLTVIVGVRKDSDGATAAVLEHSATSSATSGTFAVWAPLSATTNFTFRSRGTLPQDPAHVSASWAAPVTAVVTGLGNIGGDSAILRVNGVVRATAAGDQGTGNYTSQTLHMGARAGTSLFFSGRVYGWIVIGRLLSAGELAQAEAWMAGKCGLTL